MSDRVGDAFTEAEYTADPAAVIAHATRTGCAVIVRPDGSPRVVISIPRADPAPVSESDRIEALDLALLRAAGRIDSLEAEVVSLRAQIATLRDRQRPIGGKRQR